MQKSLRSPRQQLLQTLLSAARKDGNLTQAELAERLNKPQSFVAKYENGERRIDVIEFIDITRALDIQPVDILGQIGADADRRRA
ncbi:helix-turn-helix transcriptional regulator [Brevundimonas sp. EYE_349]|uniref:helix-turn-helix domain-containing protein n=1 Tax=Brevundimonas sp. EYE_349 TaxID=2853455 RepID=UPI0020034E3D|nr:helix-turn-helix transcriptional regulator [Brevundimonas sp. EYE_349]MCK6103657.1 helix-turn-helix domain-containing protein [Brevundimonas sp. EYE_349]